MARSTDPTVEKSIAIPKSLVEKTEVLLREPMTMRVQHGAWSRLVTQLLRTYHEDLASGRANLPHLVDF